MAIIYCVTQFYDYLYERTFVSITDHKPLTQIFNPIKSVSVTTANRLQKWAIKLVPFTYEIEYRSSERNGNADALSRFPGGPDLEFDKKHTFIYHLDDEVITESITIDFNTVAKETASDKVIKQVLSYVTSGWPGNVSGSLRPYFAIRAQLVEEGGVLMHKSRSRRIRISENIRCRVLKLIHLGHWGVSRCKQLAQNFVYWPRINRDIEELVGKC